MASICLRARLPAVPQICVISPPLGAEAWFSGLRHRRRRDGGVLSDSRLFDKL